MNFTDCALANCVHRILLENSHPRKNRFHPSDRYSSDFRDFNESFAFHNPCQSSLSARTFDFAKGCPAWSGLIAAAV